MSARVGVSRVRAGVVGVAALAVAGLAGVPLGSPATAAPVDDLIAWYQLDETSGTAVDNSVDVADGGIGDAVVVGTPSWAGAGEGFAFSGGANSAGNAIELPDDVLAGRDQVTVDMDVWVDPTLSGNWFLFNLGNQTSYPNGTGYLFVTGEDAQGRYRGTIAENGYATEQSAYRPGALAKGVWKQVTYTVDGGTAADPGTARLYEDGRLVASTPVTTSPALLGTPDGSSVLNVLGRSAYPADLSFKGRMRDVRIYDRALDPQEVATEAGATAARAAEELQVVNSCDVRGNLTLATTGPYGSSVAWTSSNPAVVATTGVVDRPAAGSGPVAVTLTAAVTLGGTTTTRQVPLVVQPEPGAFDPEGYAFAYFAGEQPNGERIFMAGSRGNDPLAFDDLNQSGGVTQPILTSQLGEKGLRDPFLIRSPEGDRFFLLATDLKIDGRPANFGGGSGFGGAQENGSLSLMVWESTDLVHWSAQRQVQVSSAFAGNTWAPEAFWDEARGEYLVYWASALYPTPAASEHRIASSYQRMMYATTRDFVTFSEARPWVDVNRGSGRGMIDATIIKDGSTFYRVIKDEQSFTVRQEKSPDLRATVQGSLPTTTSPATGWQLVAERLGFDQPNPWGGVFREGEGPTLFRDNEVPGRVYMFVDQPSYHGGQGYVAFRTDDLASGTWTSVPSAQLPSSPRHGTVIPVSAAELQRVRSGYTGGGLFAGEPTPGTVVGQSTATCPPVGTPPVVTPPVVTPPVVTPPATPPATAPVVTVAAPSRARAGSRPTVSVALSSAPAGARATVTVTRKVVKVVQGRKKRRTRTVLVTQVPVVAGVGSLALPRLRPGKLIVTTTYTSASGTTTDRAVIRVRAGRRAGR